MNATRFKMSLELGKTPKGFKLGDMTGINWNSARGWAACVRNLVFAEYNIQDMIM